MLLFAKEEVKWSLVKSKTQIMPDESCLHCSLLALSILGLTGVILFENKYF